MTVEKSVIRVMPEPLSLGQYVNSTIGTPMLEWEEPDHVCLKQHVMGYNLPSWQREFVWTKAQSISLIESVWLGLNIGTYTFNRNYEDPKLNNLLIDGQQRMKAIQDYLCDEFTVFDYFWSELPRPEQRRFEQSHFHSYITMSDDEKYLRNYYNMVNFSGTAHKKHEKA